MKILNYRHSTSTLKTNTEGLRYYGWVVVAFSFVASAMVIGTRFSIGIFLPYFPDAFQTTPAIISTVLGATLLLAALLQPIVGYLYDQLGARVIYSLGLILSATALLGAAYSLTFWHFALIYIIASAPSYAALSPASTTTVLSKWFSKKRGVAIGIATSGTKVAMIMLPAVMGYIIVIHTWQMALATAGFAMLALSPFVLLFMKSNQNSKSLGSHNTHEERDEISISWQSAICIPSFWFIVVIFFSNGFTMNLVLLHLPSFLLYHGYDKGVAATGLTLIAGFGIFGTVFSGWLSDRFGCTAVLMLMFLARAVAIFLVWLNPSNLTFLLFLMIFGILGYGSIAVIGSLMAKIFGRSSIGAIIGIAYLFNQIGGAAGAVSGGLSLSWSGNFQISLLVAIMLTLIVMPCIFLLWKLSPPGER